MLGEVLFFLRRGGGGCWGGGGGGLVNQMLSAVFHSAPKNLKNFSCSRKSSKPNIYVSLHRKHKAEGRSLKFEEVLICVLL